MVTFVSYMKILAIEVTVTSYFLKLGTKIVTKLLFFCRDVRRNFFNGGGENDFLKILRIS